MPEWTGRFCWTPNQKAQQNLQSQPALLSRRCLLQRDREADVRRETEKPPKSLTHCLFDQKLQFHTLKRFIVTAERTTASRSTKIQNLQWKQFQVGFSSSSCQTGS